MQCILCLFARRGVKSPSYFMQFQGCPAWRHIKKYYHCRVKEKRNSRLHGLFPKMSSEEHFGKLFSHHKRKFPREQPCWIGLKFCSRQPIRHFVKSGAAKFLQGRRMKRLTEATHNRQACLPPSVSQEHNRATPYSFLKTTKSISILMQQAFSSLLLQILVKVSVHRKQIMHYYNNYAWQLNDSFDCCPCCNTNFFNVKDSFDSNHQLHAASTEGQWSQNRNHQVHTSYLICVPFTLLHYQTRCLYNSELC